MRLTSGGVANTLVEDVDMTNVVARKASVKKGGQSGGPFTSKTKKTPTKVEPNDEPRTEFCQVVAKFPDQSERVLAKCLPKTDALALARGFNQCRRECGPLAVVVPIDIAIMRLDKNKEENSFYVLLVDRKTQAPVAIVTASDSRQYANAFAKEWDKLPGQNWQPLVIPSLDRLRADDVDRAEEGSQPRKRPKQKVVKRKAVKR
jgi:hypothetical protein